MPETDLPSDQRKIAAGFLLAAPIAAGLWLGLRAGLPPIDIADPFRFALGWVAVAMALTLLPGIEAVAHERLLNAAIDPLVGFETRRMGINRRYLANTVEQALLFAPGLLMLAGYVGDQRTIAATAMVWIAARWVFWIGYHRARPLRAPGLVGMAQSIIVLLYVVWRFASEAYGAVAGVAVLAMFGAIEAYLFLVLARPPRR